MHDRASDHYGQLKINPAEEIWRQHTTFLRVISTRNRRMEMFMHQSPSIICQGLLLPGLLTSQNFWLVLCASQMCTDSYKQTSDKVAIFQVD